MGSQVKLTDAEKTRRLAEGCMGWKYSRADKHHHAAWKTVDGGYLRYDVWQPLHNEAHAAEVRERMRELGWETQLTYGTIKDWAGVNDCKGTQFLRHGKRGTMTRVSSEVSLLALGMANEEEL